MWLRTTNENFSTANGSKWRGVISVKYDSMPTRVKGYIDR